MEKKQPTNLDPEASGLDEPTRRRRRALAKMQQMSVTQLSIIAVKAGVYPNPRVEVCQRILRDVLEIAADACGRSLHTTSVATLERAIRAAFDAGKVGR